MANRRLGVLTIDVVARIGGYVDGLTKVERETQQRGKRIEQTWRTVGAAATTALGGLGVAALSREYIQLADTFQNISARIRLVTSSSAEFVAVQQQVFDIAQRSRTGFEQTADLYARLSRATGSLGIDQKELLEVTESINQALTISGGSAESANAALIQLGQGFASGVLRGEELNSVLEQAPRLAQAIATGLGVALGDLRKLGERGELTADRVFKALRSQTNSIQNEFDQLPTTVSQATTQVGNSVILLVGEMDSATGASSTFAGTLTDVSGALTDLSKNIKLAASGADGVGFLASAFQTISETIRVLYANISFVLTSIGREIGAVAAQLVALGRLDFKGFRAISDAVKEDGARARAELDRLEYSILNRLNSRAGAGRGTAADPRSLGDPGSIIDQIGRPKPMTTPGKKTADPYAEAQRYLESLQKQVLKVQELSTYETALAEIQSGRLGKVTSAQNEQILAVAKEIDALKALEKEREESAKRLEENNAEVQRLFKEARSAIESVETPLETYNRKLRENAELVKNNPFLSDDTLARLNAKAWDEFSDSFEKINTQLEETDNWAKELGLTFNSAFEDAIAGGKGFRDIIGGIEQDIIRLVTRQLVTKPFANYLEGALGGLFGGGNSFVGPQTQQQMGDAVFGQLGKYATGGSGGGGFLSNLFSGFGKFFGFFAEGGMIPAGGWGIAGEAGPEIISGPATVTPMSKVGGVTVNISQSFAPGTDRRTVNQAALDAQMALTRAQRNA